MRVTNLCNAFIASGIYQFSPEAILLETYAPSLLSEDSGAGNTDGVSNSIFADSSVSFKNWSSDNNVSVFCSNCNTSIHHNADAQSS